MAFIVNTNIGRFDRERAKRLNKGSIRTQLTGNWSAIAAGSYHSLALSAVLIGPQIEYITYQ